MKSKRLLCTVLACVVMISCITNVAAIQEEVADDFVEYNFRCGMIYSKEELH